jgi:uncharacterized YccA/Bax inhibitor family protein
MADLFKTANPALGQNTFRDVAGYGGDTMTVSGAVNKAGILMLLCVASAAWTWNRFFATGDPSSVAGLLGIGAIGGLVLAVVTVFKKEWAGITAPLYSLAEGLVLGGISAMFEMRYKGIAIQAVMLTFGTMVALLLVYRTGIIKVTDKFRIGVVAATGGIALFYLAQFVLSFFHISFHAVNSGSPVGIAFSLLVVGVAALNLVLDFDLIEQGARYNAPKYMEWYCAFALMVTLIWLYLEMLRLLAKFRSRD